jgi:DNA-binding LytR/AlgR family response regulator
MKQTYIIIDDDLESVSNTQTIAGRFRNLTYVASANNYDDGVNLILEHQPTLVFLEIDPADKKSALSLSLINELYRFLKVVPKIIITTKTNTLAYEALQYTVVDYLLKPLDINNFRKAILKLDRATSPNSTTNVSKESVSTFEVLDETELEEVNLIEEIEEIKEEEEKADEETVLIRQAKKSDDLIPFEKEQTLIICVKSYGDYRYIDSNDILYFEADNNSTDIHLNNGEMITAFKTLKHFETVLPTTHFLRIHNSYMINIAQVSRIHTGNTVCYIKNSTTKLPFSKSYKENIDLIIARIAAGNYLEI